MGFTLNIAAGVKKPAVSKPNKISRLVLGTTIVDDGVYKISVSLKNDPDYPDYIIVPFTTDSLSCKNKTYVYEKEKTNNKHILHVLTEHDAKYKPYDDKSYTPVIEGVVCSGNILRINEKLYFQIKNTHGRGRFTHDIPNKIVDKPLFE